MAATRITPQTITTAGPTPTFEAANVDGHTFEPGSRVFLEVINGGGSPAAVLMAQRPDNWTEKASTADTLLTVTVPAGERRRIGPLRQSRFRISAGGTGVFGFLSTPTSVTVAIFEI